GSPGAAGVTGGRGWAPTPSAACSPRSVYEQGVPVGRQRLAPGSPPPAGTRHPVARPGRAGPRTPRGRRRRFPLRALFSTSPVSSMLFGEARKIMERRRPTRLTKIFRSSGGPSAGGAHGIRETEISEAGGGARVGVEHGPHGLAGGGER